MFFQKKSRVLNFKIWLITCNDLQEFFFCFVIYLMYSMLEFTKIKKYINMGVINNEKKHL